MFNSSQVKLGIAPINWTNDDLPELGGHIPLEQCLDEMVQAGFQGCELGNKFPRKSEDLKSYLEPRSLQLASGWFSTYFTEGKQEETLHDFISHRDFLYEMGTQQIIVSECGHCVQGKLQSVFDTKPVFNELQWKALADGLEKLATLAQEKNMEITYHYHMGTGVQTRDEVDRLMELTDPEKVSLLVDTGHITYAGGDALSLTKAYLPRIKYVHLKDIRGEVLDSVHKQRMSFIDSVKAGVFTVPGDGMIDYRPIFEALSSQNYRGWFVVEAEQDPDKANPLEYAQKARQYLRETINL